MIYNGINFWVVHNKKKDGIHEIEIEICGNQKWNGLAPIFINNLNIKNKFWISNKKFLFENMNLNIMILLAITWIIKYFIILVEEE